MTRFFLRVTSAAFVVCVVVVLLAQVVGRGLPPEEEIVFTALFSHVFDVSNFEIYRMSLARGLMIRLTHNKDFDAQPVWSPDGQEIAFVNSHDNQRRIYMMDAKGGDVRRLTADDVDENRPMWSPDGQYIAYEKLVYSFSSALFILNRQTGKSTLLTDGDSVSNSAAWSPDSKQVTFAADPNKLGIENVYTVEIDNRAMTPTIKSDVDASVPAWSPDGRYLSYIGGRPRFKHIYLWDTQRSESVLLYSAVTYIPDTPSWSADGQSLIFTLVPGGDEPYIHIYKLDIARCMQFAPNCQLTQLTSKRGSYLSPAWRPTQP